MKVKDLIAALSKLDQNLDVITYDHEWGYFPGKEPTIVKNIEIRQHFTNKPSIKIKKAVMI